MVGGSGSEGDIECLPRGPALAEGADQEPTEMLPGTLSEHGYKPPLTGGDSRQPMTEQRAGRVCDHVIA